ncbi:MAG: RtcB family protein [Cyanobacteria bacterium SBLK]|nr:RtcB family protein [Cyanobacteria bacterium SBLK]
MQQPKKTSSKKLPRILKALSRQGLNVSYQNGVYSVRLNYLPDAPVAEVLLPENLPVEGKAFKQLAELASIQHPQGGKVTRTLATPDFHPGDAGVAIGSIAQTRGMVIPAAVGSDINCGMRLHVADLSLSEFLQQRDRFVELMKGDYFLGTRDVTMTAQTARALFSEGILGWWERMKDRPLGSVAQSDFEQLFEECDRVYLRGSLKGDIRHAPEDLVPETGIVRDGDLATIGGGNHFVEIQQVTEVADRATAYQWGIREGQLAFMVHSGSRTVGKYIGKLWRDRARKAWANGLAYPTSRLFPLSTNATPDLVKDYLQAEATAANYGFVNRLLLAELLRLRLRQVYGDIEAPLVYDLPHNLTLSDRDGWITRKGACPAHLGQPVIIPGSMGASSYLLVGSGREKYLSSASHGAGRMRSRFEMQREGTKQGEEALGLKGVDCITLREERRIEEAPAAYKPIQPIIDAQVEAGIVQIVAKLQPILTFKG